MSALVSFLPEWVSSPGDTIAEAMSERSLDRLRTAQLLGIEPKSLESLLAGELQLTPTIARHLASVFGPNADFWVRREIQYRKQLMRRHDACSEGARQWLLELPVSEMVNFGWIEPRDNSVQSTALACQRYFGVPDVKAWRREYEDCMNAAIFRTSETFASTPGAVAAWLRQGEVQAGEMQCEDWDPDGFKAELQRLRALTRLPAPSQFVPKLQHQCARFGVAVVVARAPNGCRASGACRILNGERSLLMLSFRYLSDDHFWFTFFHEAGHLLLHRKRALHLEGDGGTEDQEEMEANHFAQEILVPPAFWDAMLRLPRETREIVRFATRIGISPGIVVGQLQHKRHLMRHQMNALKRRYKWMLSP
jgi:plasmid maintenance system antidote protein VapI